MIAHFTGLELGLLVLVVEFALLALAVAWLALRRTRQQAQSATAEATALVEQVEVSALGRKEALTTIIRDTYRFDETEAATVVSDFIERERAFYNALIGVHLGRGGKTLADVPSEFTKVVAPWLKLTPRNMVEAESVAALEHTNQALAHELGQTQRVLDALMAEYNAAFMKGQAPRSASRDAAAAETQELLSMDDALPADEEPGGGVEPAAGADREPPAAGAATAPSATRDPERVAAGPVESPDSATQGAEGGFADDAEPADWDFEQSGEVIALDRDLDEMPAADGFDDRTPLTPGDLDALMDNLDLEPPRAGVAV